MPKLKYRLIPKKDLSEWIIFVVIIPVIGLVAILAGAFNAVNLGDIIMVVGGGVFLVATGAYIAFFAGNDKK